jgi:hypothetical protein
VILSVDCFIEPFEDIYFAIMRFDKGFGHYCLKGHIHIAVIFAGITSYKLFAFEDLLAFIFPL